VEAIDLLLKDVGQFTGVQGFERVQLHRAFAVLFFEAVDPSVAFLDRRARQAILLALSFRQHHRLKLDVEILIRIPRASKELDFPPPPPALLQE
jgi:hypothetical protein